ncbi:Acg family FMN-binding oxidoreductase [Streptomyces sp. NBC_01264]|uniref:Acg family FMN-binding oxidoreductase n=1 Tax=Streptomyces sp. NBC_01264 TaxID=2903804 RepID=UPI002256F094|nr:nitroreductase family protein [Streptomyces sp. NBC_01264]MCX4781564.1 nitroreductase family protein [Streptomyces sp. NBC_01264]
MTASIPEPAEVVPLIEDAVMAPSMHNAQPWKFLFRPASGSIELYGDPGRAMPLADPDHRALHLGCAAALFNLRVSAAWAGRGANVRVLPDRDDPWLLAAVDLKDPEPKDRDLGALHPAIRRRHSSRFPFSEEEIPPALLDGLQAAALLEGCRLLVPDAWHTDTVLGLIHDSEHREEMDLAVAAETMAWTHTGTPDQQTRPDGIPVHAFGPKHTGRGGGVRDFGRSQHIPGRAWAAFERNPHIALLGTSGDRPEDWMRAGQALQRVLLQATADGLVTSMTSQPLEWPELRWTVRDPGSAMNHVQMVIRLGYGPQGPATPRRPVAEVLHIR